MAKKSKKEYELIPVIDCRSKDKKLDYEEIENALIDNMGQGSTAFYNFDFYHVAGKFKEKDEKQKYELSFEILADLDSDLYFVVGQSGLFLKTKNDSYFYIESVFEKYSDFINLCKCFVFQPIGIIHISDGDCYIPIRKIKCRGSKEKIKRLFNSVEFFDEGE